MLIYVTKLKKGRYLPVNIENRIEANPAVIEEVFRHSAVRLLLSKILVTLGKDFIVGFCTC